MEPGPCIVCGDPAQNAHHRKLRSQGGGEEHYNIIRLCGSGTTGCHGLVHANPAAAYMAGLLVRSWQDPKEVEPTPGLFRELLAEHFVRGAIENASGAGVLVGPEVLRDGLGPVEHDHPEVEPGQECPKCHRRVPKPKKATSPTTKPVTIGRAPIDDIEDFEQLFIDTAKHLGVYEKSHWKFWVTNYALANTLQDETLKGALGGS